MLRLRGPAIATLVVALALVATACGGDGEEAPATPAATTPAATPTAAAPPAASPAAEGTAPSAPTAPDAAAPTTSEEARDKLSRASIILEDLPAGFTVLSDEFSSNEEAAQAPSAAPDSAELFEQCGRLLGRTVTYMAEDAESAVLAGEPLAYFSSVTAFADAEGASSCYQETLRRSAEGEGGSIGRQFGDLFVDPDNVDLTLVDFPTVGEQSLAFTVSGDTDAEGLVIGIVILAVSFRQGPTTAIVGAVRVVVPPDQEHVEPFARLVAQRIQEEFGP